jgi:hypothetical protein
VGYDLTQVHVSALVPSGGPIAGETQVVVLGSGFADYNVHCQFGGSGTPSMVRAVLLNSSALRCSTPVQAAANGAELEVTLNGDDATHSLTSDGVIFSYFNGSEARIEGVAPLGGPTEGGTLVTLSGRGFADHGGVYCRFGSSSASVVAATRLSDTRLKCLSPAVVTSGEVALALTLNSNLTAFIVSTTNFSYFGSRAVHVSLVTPAAGPRAGGSLLNISGSGFAALGGVRCRFGRPTLVTEATVVDEALVRCVSPALTGGLGGTVVGVGQRERVQVTLNGQDYTSSEATFVGYDLTQVHVSALVPSGGPIAGETQVVVLGSGFAD